MVSVRIKELVQKFLINRGLILIMTIRYLGRRRSINLARYAGDYVRNSSLELVAYEIAARKVKGNVAEIGVYQGDFAKIINKVFPDRKLYLFDTFEGFNRTDVLVDRDRAYSLGSQDFSQTSVDTVLKKMSYPQNCIIKKGHFPESAQGLEGDFVFVSIDADLFKPVYEGLRFFYPRLVRGGYIFVHDYNNDEYKGTGEAVRQYCVENDIAYFPLSDACGSAIIAR